jgi:YVTN family beta-propeller protein
MTRTQQMRAIHAGYLAIVTLAVLAIVLVFVKTAIAGGPKAYVGNFKDNTVSVIDLESNRVAATIPVPPGPHYM